MKTFSTSGTGNQQTLSEIESDKIPIYDSLTDVEADLANLEEGQIVATKDEGSELSAPVDTVQSGNMHAVTSNAVSKGLSYSTTEHKTGGTWIDGKPIYRMAFDVSLNSPTQLLTISSQLSSSNIIPIKMVGLIRNSYDGNYLATGYGDGVSLGLTTNSLCMTSHYNFNRVIVVIEYVKS